VDPKSKKITFLSPQTELRMQQQIADLEKRVGRLEQEREEAAKPKESPVPDEREGKFITFEGIDGSGKSSVIDGVADFLGSKGIEVLINRQPGGSRTGERIRKFLLDPASEITPLTEVLFFAASFNEGMESVIGPALKAGKWVLCDRWTDSTMAYQCGGRGLPPDVVETILSLVTNRVPDMTIFCDIPPDTAADRCGIRGNLDRIELEGLEFQRAVHQFYLNHTILLPRTRIVNTGGLDKEACVNHAIGFINKLI